jgi:hypothetical protein
MPQASEECPSAGQSWASYERGAGAVAAMGQRQGDLDLTSQAAMGLAWLPAVLENI